MKSQKNRLFWTALGSRLLGEQEDFDTSELPAEMQKALDSLIQIPISSLILCGEGLEGKRNRHIYMYSWKILRNMSFSRPFRCEVFPSVQLFVPFYRDKIVVLPQGLTRRIPLKLRAHALVGKNAALRTIGYHLVIVAAVYEKATWDILEKGGCLVCTPDKLEQLIEALDLS